MRGEQSETCRRRRWAGLGWESFSEGALGQGTLIVTSLIVVDIYSGFPTYLTAHIQLDWFSNARYALLAGRLLDLSRDCFVYRTIHQFEAAIFWTSLPYLFLRSRRQVSQHVGPIHRRPPPSVNSSIPTSNSTSSMLCHLPPWYVPSSQLSLTV